MKVNFKFPQHPLCVKNGPVNDLVKLRSQMTEIRRVETSRLIMFVL